ncbi:MAG: tRNA (adenosine(37)-N6)-threonylcarbamoyltransferase complex dimerization subunit type 1 TsaB [Gemmatimonadaceae bacterium]
MTTDGYSLAIDGSTYEGSVALLRGSHVVAERTLKEEDGAAPRAGRGERLMPAIADCLREADIARGEIARIVCGSGPGSFTSLRVAGSVAKGLAAGLSVDLYAVSSLLLTVTGAKPPVPSGEYLSVLDAMRGEFFAARITKSDWASEGTRRMLNVADIDWSIDAKEIDSSTALGVRSLQPGPTAIMSRHDLDQVRVRDRALKIIGPGQDIDARPHARGVAPILDWITQQGAVDLASWEPDYGRLAEAQVRWEAAHGRKLTT